MNVDRLRQISEMKTNLLSASFSVGVNEYDCSDYPEDTWPALQAFCKLWGFAPPALRSKKGRGAFWLQSLRELNEAAAEFRVDELLEEYHKEWMDYIKSHGGVTNRTIESPKSLVGAVAAQAAKKRREQLVETPDAREKHINEVMDRFYGR